MKWVSRGAFTAFAGVLFGAFGAHALKPRVSQEHLAIYQTGVFYHLVHSLALILFGIWAAQAQKPDRIAWLFWIGIFIFSGSLYALAITGIGLFGAITPIGGFLFLTGWLMWGWAAR